MSINNNQPYFHCFLFTADRGAGRLGPVANIFRCDSISINSLETGYSLIECLPYSRIVYPVLIDSPEGQEIQYSHWVHCEMVNIATKMARMVGIVSMMVNIVTKICFVSLNSLFKLSWECHTRIYKLS